MATIRRAAPLFLTVALLGVAGTVAPARAETGEAGAGGPLAPPAGHRLTGVAGRVIGSVPSGASAVGAAGPAGSTGSTGSRNSPGSNTAFAGGSSALGPGNAGAAMGSQGALTAVAATGSAGSNAANGSSGATGSKNPRGFPLAAVGVYAYQLADLTLHRVVTDAEGNFLFQDLPAGLYKVIAHKAGFEPAVIMLTRTTAQAYQFLELQLAKQDRARAASGASGGASDDFWSLRAHVPGDVLREIEAYEAPRISPLPRGGEMASLRVAALAKFHTEMQASTGVDQVPQLGAGQVASGRLGIEGDLGDVRVGLRGRFSQVNTAGLVPHGGAADGQGQSSALSLDLQAGAGSRISLTSAQNRMMPSSVSGVLPVAFQHYGLAWSQALGEGSHSELLAQYTSENNFNRQSPVDPAYIPGASRTWRVEGSYTTAWSDSSTLQAGIRYREQQFGLMPGAGGAAPGLQQLGPPQTGRDNLDVYGRGGTRILPAVLLEYGLYNTLRDGTVALTPQGGLVLELSEGWQLHTTVSHKAYENAAINPSFLPTLFKEEDICEQGARSCYQGDFSHHFGDEGLISFGAVQRSIGDTLRLYFSEDFFDRLESLYLVPGDRLPEVRFSITERVAPHVVTRLESNLASGGGGTFAASDGQPYRNKVRYLVTSLDTRFQSTGTGVFVALHRMRQDLAPLGAGTTISGQFDRLQVMLTQDLNKRFNLAAAWALQLNLELSRDATPYLSGADRELHRRVLGGLAVRF
jgi:hypothetical protein